MPFDGARIKQRRVEKGLALAELARRLEISKGYLHSMENGAIQSPSADVLMRIAKELGTTITDLLGEESASVIEEIPNSLAQFAAEADLTEADVHMLAHIEYRGKRPDHIDDWRFIYEAIKRTLR